MDDLKPALGCPCALPSYRVLFCILCVEGRENLGLLRSRQSPLIHFPILKFQAEFVVTFISLIHAKHCLTFFKTGCQFLALHCESFLR